MATRSFPILCLLAIQFVIVPRRSAADSTAVYLQLSPAVKAVLYSPDASIKAHVAVVNMHEDGNRLHDIACTELVKRGFYVLCMNGRSDNNEALDYWNDLPLDVATGVKYLKETVKASKILLYGGSGGGPLMTFYQNVAQNGPSVCQGANKLIPCGNELANLPAADGIILRDAHPGTAVNTLRSVNPSLQRDDKPGQIVAALDPFSGKNGFNGKGPSHYSREFQERYFKAQAARMNRLVDGALAKLRAMEAGKYYYRGRRRIRDPWQRRRPSGGDGSDDPSRHRQAAKAIEERWHDRDRSDQERARRRDEKPRAREIVLRRGEIPDGAIVSRHACDPRQACAGRYRLLLQQQLDALPSAENHRADPDPRHGRPLFFARQRDSLRSLRQHR